MPYYDPRIVPSHGSPDSKVFLVNEAPGPCEAHYGIPSVGAQGGNIYRALRRANVEWACNFEEFKWPNKILKCYKDPERTRSKFELRDKFLSIRAKHITCSNAFSQWPRSDPTKWDWQNPSCRDVLSESNLARLKEEIPLSHQVILVCGEFAWLACHGTALSQPSTRERKELNPNELSIMNSKLSSHFKRGWYMGHTRRWSLDATSTSVALKGVADVAGWNS